MALLPEVHVNFGQVTFERIYQIFLPLIPGGTLVGGLVATHPEAIYKTTVALGMGRYSRVAALVFAAYAVGLVLYAFSQSVTGTCSFTLTLLVFAKWPPTRQNEAPSKSWVWRTVASEFLGKSLTPPPSAAPLPPLLGHDVEWMDLYNVLQDYVLRAVGIFPNEVLLLMSYLQATGWALLYLYFRTAARGHWSILLVSVVAILTGATAPFGINFFYFKYDRMSAWDFTARLINEIRLREANAGATSDSELKR